MNIDSLHHYHEEFLSYLSVEKNSSPLTIASYRSDFKNFSTYLSGCNIQPTLTNLNTPVFRSYIHYMKENLEYKTTTIRRKINGLKSFYAFLQLQDYITDSPMKKITVPNKAKLIPIYFTESQVKRILLTAKQSREKDALRDYILIKLIATTGIRRQEAVNLNFNDIDFGNSSVKVFGKGSRERVIPINQDFSDELWMYLQSRLPLVNQAVFITSTGHRIHASRCQTFFKRLLNKVGLDNQGYSLHKLRHSYATMLIANGAAISSVQLLLGHQDINTTTIYAHTSAQQLRETTEKLPY